MSEKHNQKSRTTITLTSLWSKSGDTTISGSEIKLRIEDIALQEIKGKCRESNKGKNYLILKDKWTMENYMHLLDDKDVFQIFKFRTSNHKLPVETGRFHNIDYHDRKCPKCNIDIGDEFHYLMKCPFFNKERKLYLTEYQRKHPNMIIFTDIMKSSDKLLLKKMCNFSSAIMNRIRT